MSRQAIIEYITALIGLYRSANKQTKTEYLNQAVAITGKSRRTIQRYLEQDPKRMRRLSKIQGRGRAVVYEADIYLPHIRRLWRFMEMISSERFKQALPLWLPYYNHPDCTEEVKLMLLQMSRGTIERFLSILRVENTAKKGLSTTSSALRSFKAKIPINTLDHEVIKPGYTQVDTVAHCGQTTAGQYINSITLTDLFSGWTENRALESKKALHVKRTLSEFMKTVPFELIAINTDSGSEFINSEIFEMMNPYPIPGQRKILFTRSRPYRKNDNCYVEQRNYTHVRQLFGYYRYEEISLVSLMNEIYINYWNPLHNYFLPSQKLVQKTRVGAKLVKKHDIPQTPAQRLLNSTHVPQAHKQVIIDKLESTDPFLLAQGLQDKLRVFFDLYKQSITNKNKEAA
jgi:hypothetical protein